MSHPEDRWTRIQKLPPELVEDLKTMYKETFPMEIRTLFADWIEKYPWGQMDENSEKDKTDYAMPLLQELLTQIQGMARFLPTLEGVFSQLEAKYFTDPLLFIRDMKTCMTYEQDLLARRESVSKVPDTLEEIDIVKLNKEFESVTKLSSISSDLLKDLEVKQQEFTLILHEVSRVEVELESRLKIFEEQNELSEEDAKKVNDLREKLQQFQEQKRLLPHFAEQIWNCITTLKEKLHVFFNEIVNITTKVLDEGLRTWKHKQQLACNGEPLDPTYIQNIQKRCGRVQELIKKCSQITSKLEELYKNILTMIQPYKGIHDYTSFIQDLQKQLYLLLISLVERTFIVEKQPPQILNTSNKFNCSISLLVGKVVNTHRGLPKVTAYLIDEETARNNHKGGNLTVKNAIGRLELVKGHKLEVAFEELPSGAFSANLTNLTATKFKDRRSQKCVQKITETKYCIVFETEVKIGDDGPFHLQVLSLPVMVISHVSYYCDALATIMWDHQFSHMERQPFDTRNSVMWPEMASLLNEKFKSETGRCLTDENLNYIASKLFGQKQCYSCEEVTKEMFCKNDLQGLDFSFWTWIYHIIKLTKEHLSGPWRDSHIIGFVSKADAVSRIRNAENGRFLHRFSDSVKGGVSVVFKKKSRVNHYQPLTSKDFEIRSFSQLVLDTKMWKCLYPRVPKEEIFQKYIDNETENLKTSNYTRFIWTIRQIAGEEEDENDLTNVIPDLIENFPDEQLEEMDSSDPELLIEQIYCRQESDNLMSTC